MNRDYWDLKVSVVLWAYKTTCKNITGHTPFRMVYGKKPMVPLDYLVPIMCIATITNMTEEGNVQERLDQLMDIEEDKFLVGFHQKVQKSKEKSWHDRNIKKKIFKEGDLVLLYENMYLQHPGKFKMHWLRNY